MEKKKETLISVPAASETDEMDYEEDIDEEDFDEYLDWRSKKGFE